MGGDTITAERVARSGNGGAVDAARLVRPRRGLPGGRAVVGGFLVAVAAVGTFGAWTASTAGPRTAYVVAARDLAPGEQLTAADLTLVPMELPAGPAGAAFTDPAVLEGATLLGPLARDELVQAGSVVRPLGGPDTVQTSFAIDAAAALNGNLKRGERIDLLVTYGSGESATVRRVATGALVVEVVQGREVVGSSGSLVLVLAVDPGEVTDIAHAAAAGSLRVIRTTGAAAGGSTSSAADGADDGQ